MTYLGYSLSTRLLDGCDHETALVNFRGSILSSDYEHFSRDLNVIVQENHFVVADFSEVTYLSSPALGLLADIFVKNQESKGAFCICSLQADPLRVCKITGLGELIPVFTETEQALLFLRDLIRGVISSEWDFSRNLDRSLLQIDLATAKGLDKLRTIITFDEDHPATLIIRNRLDSQGNNITCAKSCEEIRNLLRQSQHDLLVTSKEHPQYDEICQIVQKVTQQPTLSMISIAGCVPEEIENRLSKAVCKLCGENGDFKNLTTAQQHQIIMGQPLFCKSAEMSLHSDEASRYTAEIICRKLSLICGLSGEKADNFYFALREALDNACRHGNKSDPDKRVWLRFARQENCLKMTVTDEGNGFDYEGWLQNTRNKNPILQATEQKEKGLVGGLGLMLIDRCCDNMRFNPPGNSLTITENL